MLCCNLDKLHSGFVKGEINDHITLVNNLLKTCRYLDTGGAEACILSHILTNSRTVWLLKGCRQGQIRILLHHKTDALAHTAGSTGNNYFSHIF